MFYNYRNFESWRIWKINVTKVTFWLFWSFVKKSIGQKVACVYVFVRVCLIGWEWLIEGWGDHNCIRSPLWELTGNLKYYRWYILSNILNMTKVLPPSSSTIVKGFKPGSWLNIKEFLFLFCFYFILKLLGTFRFFIFDSKGYFVP